MKIIYRYIARNVLIATAIVFFVVTSLSFIFGMMKELHNIGEGDYGFIQIVIHEILVLPHEIYQFFPMLVLLGGVLGLGMLAVSHELMVMRAAGISTWQIVRSVIAAALVLIIIATVLGELIAPSSNFLAQKRKSLAQTLGQAVVTMSGVWVHEGNNFLHIEQVIGRKHLVGVTRYEFDNEHHLLSSAYAETVDFENGQWIAHDLTKTTISHDKTKAQYFPQALWHLKLTPNLLNVGLVEADAMSLHKLHQYSRYLVQNKLQANAFQLEFWQRLFQPLTTLVMILLAVPFVFAAPRSVSMGKRMLLAIVVGFIFYIVNAFFGEFSIVFQFPPIIAALLPTLLFATVGFVWMWRVRE